MARLPLLGASVRRAHLFVVVAALLLFSGCSAAGAMGWGDSDEDPVAAYEAALAPLKKRSDVLEQKFAEVQGQGYTGPEQVRSVLEEIIPEYAELLDETRDIEVASPDLQDAQEALVASLEKQQEGLELALRGMREGDPALVRQGGVALERAQALVDKHRRLLAAARE